MIATWAAILSTDSYNSDWSTSSRRCDTYQGFWQVFYFSFFYDHEYRYFQYRIAPREIGSDAILKSG